MRHIVIFTSLLLLETFFLLIPFTTHVLLYNFGLYLTVTLWSELVAAHHFKLRGENKQWNIDFAIIHWLKKGWLGFLSRYASITAPFLSGLCNCGIPQSSFFISWDCLCVFTLFVVGVTNGDGHFKPKYWSVVTRNDFTIFQKSSPPPPRAYTYRYSEWERARKS